jgi:hypothetical protein
VSTSRDRGGAYPGRPPADRSEPESTRSKSGALSFPACSARSTTRSTFYLALPALTLTVGFPELRCLSRTTLAFRPPPDYGSGGQPGVVAGAAHWGPVPVGHRCRVVDGPAAGCPAWPLPQCPHALRRSRVSAVPGRAGSRCSAGRVRCPGIRTAVLRWLRRPGQLTSADEQIRHAWSCRGAATAAAGPPLSCRSRTLRPV